MKIGLLQPSTMGTVLSACVAASKVSALANAQLGIVVLEMETEVAVACSAGDVYLGMSPETVMVVEGASVNMVMLAVSEVGWTEGKTGPCAAFNVDVVGQDMNTMRDVSSNLGVGTGVHLPFGVGVGMGMELGVGAGVGTGVNILWVAEGLRVACSQGQT